MRGNPLENPGIKSDFCWILPDCYGECNFFHVKEVVLISWPSFLGTFLHGIFSSSVAYYLYHLNYHIVSFCTVMSPALEMEDELFKKNALVITPGTRLPS